VRAVLIAVGVSESEMVFCFDWLVVGFVSFRPSHKQVGMNSMI
jgi:hypothetical protein